MTQPIDRESAGRTEYRYIHALRLLACWLVIVNHTHGELLHYDAPDALFLYALSFSVCKIGVTLFVMISGILLLERDYDVKKTAWYITRALVLLIGMSALLALWQEGPAGLLPRRFLPALLAGPRMAPYWYLYALPVFYLVVPFLQKMTRSFRLRDYVLFTVFLLLLPGAVEVLRVWGGPPVSSAFTLALLPAFVTIAVAGKAVSLLPLRRGGAAGALALLLLVWGVYFASFYRPALRERVAELDTWAQLPAVIMAGCCVYLFRFFRAAEGLRGRSAAVLREIAGTSLGIYVFHPVLNHRVHEQGFILSLYARSPVAGALAHTLCLFLLSGLIAFLLRRVPLIRKFL
ncbi:MAG: acyltransferase family protein [Eubacteriales bacterium]|nr:acyltransferase family protein [Eubacteriales bacterium]